MGVRSNLFWEGRGVARIFFPVLYYKNWVRERPAVFLVIALATVKLQDDCWEMLATRRAFLSWENAQANRLRTSLLMIWRCRRRRRLWEAQHGLAPNNWEMPMYWHHLLPQYYCPSNNSPRLLISLRQCLVVRLDIVWCICCDAELGSAENIVYVEIIECCSEFDAR